MTKDVIISISGMQMTDGDDSDVEIVTAGAYFQKNGKHYILYDEVMEGFDGIVKNTIKIGENGLDIIKKGVTNVHMTFEKNKKNMSCYVTPFGELMIGVNTSKISVNETEHQLKVKVDYSLDINYEHVSECNITVDVQSKANAYIHLLS